jgi:hypothetical protein
MRVWTIDPQSGGIKIPLNRQEEITKQANAFAAKCAWSKQFQLSLRYKNQFCYLDAAENGKDSFPIGRLRYFDNEWSLAFYSYGKERYEPCIFENGRWFGSLEQAIAICSMYLI